MIDVPISFIRHSLNQALTCHGYLGPVYRQYGVYWVSEYSLNLPQPYDDNSLSIQRSPVPIEPPSRTGPVIKTWNDR